MSSIGERIGELIRAENLNDYSFALRVKVSPPMIKRYREDNAEPSLSVITKILSAFPNINRDWFVFGEGIMEETCQPQIFRNGIGQRIRKIIDHSGLSDAKFAKRIYISQPMISRYVNGDSEPGYGVIISILEAFPEINRDWFIFGKGDPFVTNDSPNIYAELTYLQKQVNFLLEWRISVIDQIK